jgi:UDP-N-acetylglucosamine transferase subunit ALG13
MARVTGASLTGRIMAPLARAVLVQWPEASRIYRRATVCRPALLEAGAVDGHAPGSGTFVSLGTRPEPFDRLLEMVDHAVARGTLPQPVVAQSGASRYRPESFSTTTWMTPAEVERAIAGARYVVCHGGAGMVSAAIAAGRRPLVLPRARAAGEHRTEHQGQLVEKLAASGAVVALGDEIGESELRLADSPARDEGTQRLPSVEEVLRAELAAVFGRPGPV